MVQTFAETNIMNLPLSQAAYKRNWERIVAVLQQVGGTPPSVGAGVTSETEGKYL